jgi:hypothetical protein
MAIHNVNLDTESIRSFDEFSPEVTQQGNNERVVAVICVSRSQEEEPESQSSTVETPMHYNRHIPEPELPPAGRLGKELGLLLNMLLD